jgi:hypothetical protein
MQFVGQRARPHHWIGKQMRHLRDHGNDTISQSRAPFLDVTIRQISRRSKQNLKRLGGAFNCQPAFK